MTENGTTARPAPRRQARGTLRRDAIIRATIELILHEGPAAVTHRAVASRAGVPLAATTYYFSGLEDLIGAAGRRIAAGWTAHAAEAAKERIKPRMTDREIAELMADAVLPPGGEKEVRGFYEHLVGAGRYTTLAKAYAEGREALVTTIHEIMTTVGPEGSAAGLIAMVDGAAVAGLSENRDVRELAIGLLVESLNVHRVWAANR